ncbi:MAG: NAD(+) synthase [Bacteroidales bacterium]|nr:NAD(+) synthase [Bacteroidales bacterium]
MNDGFFRVAAAVPSVKVADCRYNTENIISMSKLLNSNGVQMAVFPELSVTGYTCGDLFHSDVLIENTEKSLSDIVEASRNLSMIIVVGAGVRYNGALYNCGIVVAQGKILAAIPKSYIPNCSEFNEKRWWTSARDIDVMVNIVGQMVPMTRNQLVKSGNVKIAIEVGEDLWSPIPPSSHAALEGAQIIVNLSACNEVMGKHDILARLIAQQSARCIAAYLYSGAGYGESTTDVVYDGKAIIAQNGRLIAQNNRWCDDVQFVYADIDMNMIDYERRHNNTFADCVEQENRSQQYKVIECQPVVESTTRVKLSANINPLPFVPKEDSQCDEAVNIQVMALCQRLDATRCKKLVIGVSGGLDSTLALLIATRVFDRMSINRKGIIGVTMPGFGTTDRTYKNAITMMQAMGITIKEISIVDAVKQHFTDIGHDINVHDATYENSQARERTQILMDIANKVGGMVLGTGDMSELALGWATYNGDHMSMYGINAGVPKTLVKCLVRHIASSCDDEKLRDSLLDVVDTPISPELVPADSNGDIKQKTEDLVGPYELHDFFMYYFLRHGFSPRRIFLYACTAFAGVYDRMVIKHWIKVFFSRFFSQQFKRSCLPDGPKVTSVSLSPRGGWCMPSDASSVLWLKECDQL